MTRGCPLVSLLLCRPPTMPTSPRLALLLVLALTACDDDGTPAPATDATPDVAAACPAVRPDDSVSCDERSVSGGTCTYLIETCACGPSDIEWTCGCTAGTWTCARGYDCYPCPDAAVTF